jgi:hypothetical protein
MANPTLIRNYTAQGDIKPRRIVVFGSADRTVVAGLDTGETSVVQPLCGVSSELGAKAGERIDIIIAGVADIEYGESITRGDMLVSGEDGRAMNIASFGTTTMAIGVAQVSGVAGDIGEVLIAPSIVSG